MIRWLRSEWDESEHPRDEDGKFTDGGGSSFEPGKPVATQVLNVKAKAPFGKQSVDVEVLVNQNRSQSLAFVKEVGSARAMTDQAGNLYLWNGTTALHHDVQVALGKHAFSEDYKTKDEWGIKEGKLYSFGSLGHERPIEWINAGQANAKKASKSYMNARAKVKQINRSDRTDFMQQCMDVIMDETDDEDSARNICEMLWEDQDIDIGEMSMTTVRKTHADEGNQTMEFVLSDATPDRYGDVIEASGWDLKNFNRNPIALFNHNSDFPIGKWEKLKVVDGKLRGFLKMAPAGTSPRIDELRNLMEAGILRAVSVGFRPLEHTRMEGSSGGIRYMKSELIETSLVSVPANPNALAVAKSMNVSRETLAMVFAKNGTEDPDKSKTVTKAGTPPIKPVVRKSTTMNITQRIVEAQNRINGLRDQLNTHIEGLDDANVTDDQTIITETLTGQIESQEKALAALQRAEASIAKAAVTRQTPGGTEHVTRGNEGGRMFAVPAKKVAPLDLLFKAITMDVKHFGEGRKRPILDVVKENYGDNDLGESVRTVMARMVTKAAAIPADTTTSGWADTLVQTVIGDFIEALMPLSVYPRLREKGGSFTFGRNGTISLPARTQSTTVAGAFVAQGAPIPVRQGAFTPITLTPKKMGVITTMTREITEHSTPQIESILRQAMLEDTAVAIDTILLDATAASTTRPAGLKNGISKVNASATASIVGFVADLKGLVAALINATNGNIRSPVWIMNPGDVLAASLLQTTVGETPFREELAGGTLLGYPVVQTTTGLSDMMGIIDAADFMTATGDTPSFSVSDQAVLHMEDTSPAAIATVGTPNAVAAPVRSLWQTDSMAIRMIMDINWAKRRAGVFQWTDTMAWN